MTTLRCYDEPAAILGEAPVWDDRESRIWWVDCDGKRLFSRDPGREDDLRTYALPHHPGSYAFREAGGMIMAYRNGLTLLDVAAGESRPFEATGVDFSRERFNDGACDRAGRFWVGTLDRRFAEPTGALYRIDPDLTVTRMVSDLVVSNGIAFSPDDRVMYHHDSRRGLVFAYDFDIDRGLVGNRRVFVDFAGRPGRPDGCTIDAEGSLWIAEIGAGRVVRFAPDGRQIATVDLPVGRPSSVAFGGDDLSTLFVTTMRHGLRPEEAERQPRAGCLWSVTRDVPGLPEPRFGG